jgi:D-alanyl-D-alanine carboxypeptidase
VSGNDRTGEWGTKLTKTSANLRGSRRVALSIVSVLSVTTITLLPAEAKRSGEGHHFRAHVVSHGRDYTPPYAAIVVDANSGNVLHSANADELRHPASLTKIMTLYLLFERIEAGRLKLDSQLPVSEHASEQAPTKLGLKPGQTIAVEDAIKGLVTKSANDAAVVVGEALGGSEAEFAEMMTKKARAIGMSRTVYRNASGLPNDEQVTTARDQALLGRAIQERFPKEYRYFSTLSFTYRGESMRNHNMLLGHVDGVDGIKTGYTQASGFNLVTSVHRNNRHVVAVVLGGTSAGARDAKMRSLLETHLASASTQKTATAFAQAGGAKSETASAGAKAEARAGKPGSTYSVASVPPSKFAPASADNQPTATVAPSGPKAAAPAGETVHAKLEVNDTIKPIQVKTIKVKLTQTQTAGLSSAITPVREEPVEAAAEPPRAVAPAPKTPAAKAIATIPAASAPIVPAPAAPIPAARAVEPASAPAPKAPVSAAQIIAALAPATAPTPVSPPPVPAPAPVAAAPAPAIAAPAAPAPAAPARAIVAPAAPASAPAPAASAPTAVAAAAPAPAAERAEPAKATAPKTFTVASALYKPARAPAFPPAPGAAPAAAVETPAPAPKMLAMAPAATPVTTPAPVEPVPTPSPKTTAPAPKALAMAPAAAPVEPAPAPAPKVPMSAAKIVAALAPAAAPAAPEPVAVPAPVVAAPAAAPIAPTPARAATPVAVAAVAPAPEAIPPEPKREAVRVAPLRTGWIIQIGAFDVEHDAQQRLTTAQAKIGHALDRADPFTEPVQKGDKTLYRARFAGFQQKDEAEAICKQLKRNDIDCMTIKN